MSERICLLGPKLFEFTDFEHWANKARALYAQHGVSLAFDTKGRLCACGSHFMTARDENAFPVSVYAIRPVVEEAKEEYAWSENEETYKGGFVSRADAAAEGFEEADESSVIWIGLVNPMTPEQVLGDIGLHIIERMGEGAFDMCGEAADGWPEATPEQTARLGVLICAAVRIWMEETGTRKLFNVDKVQEHRRGEEGGDSCR